MKPLLNQVKDDPLSCLVCGGNKELPHFHLTSPDGRFQAEEVVCEVCLFESLAPWYPNNGDADG